MAWSKSPQWLVELFGVSLPDRAGVTRRQMFGYPAAFVNGNMFAGLFEDSCIARLPPHVRAALDAEHGVRDFEPMPGRPMRAYAVLPDAVLEDEAKLAQLLASACDFAAGLPPKVPKPRKGKANI